MRHERDSPRTGRGARAEVTGRGNTGKGSGRPVCPACGQTIPHRPRALDYHAVTADRRHRWRYDLRSGRWVELGTAA